MTAPGDGFYNVMRALFLLAAWIILAASTAYTALNMPKRDSSGTDRASGPPAAKRDESEAEK